MFVKVKREVTNLELLQELKVCLNVHVWMYSMKSWNTIPQAALLESWNVAPHYPHRGDAIDSKNFPKIQTFEIYG